MLIFIVFAHAIQDKDNNLIPQHTHLRRLLHKMSGFVYEMGIIAFVVASLCLPSQRHKAPILHK